MAKIPLRKYNQEIESLIDQSHYDQAIANARHVLKYFPKHLATYRLLGKAYLESQRYGDAADLFQRVLSAIPDDFVSHVGMSIIREDEGNLDDAIWHMERAFEVQPANGAIQAELRRLYGRRDGIEPAKVRLTRAALARMYIKGELYTQAIAELRAAINEDPERPDLLNLLAQAYFANGQRVEAANICSQLMNKVPNCYEANHILAEVLAETERASESETYRQRIYNMDPYAAHTSSAAPVPDRVPETAVVVEKMVWAPGQSLGSSISQPEWATSLGVNIAGKPEDSEGLPDWLVNPPDENTYLDDKVKSVNIGDVSTAPFSQEQTGSLTELNPEDKIPEWMKAAGWQPSTGDEEIPVPLETGELEGELAPADIPEWLQAIAPDQSIDSSEFTSAETATGSKEPASELTPPTITQPETGELPDWLAGAVAAASTAASLEEKSDWVEEDHATPETPEATETQDTVAEWFNDTTPDIPSILVPPKEVTSEPINQVGIEHTQPEIPEKDASQEEDDAFAWLESLAARQGAKEALIVPPEERSETPPDWVVRAASDEITEDIPDWLREYEQPFDNEPPLPADEEIEIPTALEIVDESTAIQQESELPEWLTLPSQITEESIGTDALPISALTDTNETDYEPTVSSEELPEWLKELGPVSEEQTIQEEVLASDAFETGAAPVEIPDWLREIAPVSPEIRAEADKDREHTYEQEAEFEQLVDPRQLPDWLREAAKEQEPQIIPAVYDESGVEMLFIPAIVASKKETAPQIPIEPEILEEDTKPTHIKATQLVQSIEISDNEPIEVEEELQLPQAAELPEWLKDLEPPAEVDIYTDAVDMDLTEIIGSEEPGTVIDGDEAFAWLEGLATKQGAEEALFLKPEERLETPPDWVQKASEEALDTSAVQTEHEAETIESIPVIEDVLITPEVDIQEQEPEASDQEVSLETVEVSEEYKPVAEKFVDEGVPELPAWLAETEEPQAVDETLWMPLMTETEAEDQELYASNAAGMVTLLDLNQAGLVDLERLPGIGFIRAQAIIEHRNAYGPFTSLDDLADVPGIDNWSIEQMRDYVTVQPVEPAQLTFEEDHQIILIQARNAISQGDVSHATDLYGQIIRSMEFLPDIIHDLKEALNQFPIDVKLWSTFGDAHIRAGNLQEAVDAYCKAEELLS